MGVAKKLAAELAAGKGHQEQAAAGTGYPTKCTRNSCIFTHPPHHNHTHIYGEQPFVYLPETIPLRAPPEERNPCIGFI